MEGQRFRTNPIVVLLERGGASRLRHKRKPYAGAVVARIVGYRHSTKREVEMMVKQLITRPMPRIRAWPVPPHWSRSEWFEELSAHGTAAAWQALCDFDPSRGVPLSAFVYQRVIASALTRYRQEWSYATHCLCVASEDGQEKSTEDSLSCSASQELLRCALARLSEADQWLIKQLFWEGYTEVEIAKSLRISHQAVSKRKRLVLQALRRKLKK